MSAIKRALDDAITRVAAKVRVSWDVAHAVIMEFLDEPIAGGCGNIKNETTESDCIDRGYIPVELHYYRKLLKCKKYYEAYTDRSRYKIMPIELYKELAEKAAKFDKINAYISSKEAENAKQQI